MFNFYCKIIKSISQVLFIWGCNYRQTSKTVTRMYVQLSQTATPHPHSCLSWAVAVVGAGCIGGCGGRVCVLWGVGGERYMFLLYLFIQSYLLFLLCLFLNLYQPQHSSWSVSHNRICFHEILSTDNQYRLEPVDSYVVSKCSDQPAQLCRLI